MSLELPQWTIATSRRESRMLWTEAFEESYRTFAEKISHFIAKDIFSVLKESCADPFKAQPTHKKTFCRDYQFDILRPKNAHKLKKMSQEAGELSPFKEWFGKFAVIKNQNKPVIEEKACFLEDSCLESGPSSSAAVAKKVQFLTRTQESEIAIDGSYFKDRMAIIGKKVCINLGKIFSEFRNHPENQCLNISATWIDEYDFKVKVEFWLEDEKNELLPQERQLSSIQELKIHKDIEKSKKNREKFMEIFIISCVALAMLCLLIAAKRDLMELDRK